MKGLLDIKENVSLEDLIKEIKELLKKDGPILIAVDGPCGSGKSTLAKKLSEIYDCNIFHMDDYFLPFDMRSSKRLAEPGGNVHYERVKVEVIKPLKNGEKVFYRPFNCSLGSFTDCNIILPKKINIIEGSYSMHPTLVCAYDLRIFLTVDEKEQLKRILKRNGEDKLQNFVNKWIPMEELYFNTYQIKEHCDVIMDTASKI